MLQSFPSASPTCHHETSPWDWRKWTNQPWACFMWLALWPCIPPCDLFHVALCMGNFSHYISNTQLHLQGRFKFRLCQDINTLMRWQPCKTSGLNQGPDRLQRHVGRFMPSTKKGKRKRGRKEGKKEGRGGNRKRKRKGEQKEGRQERPLSDNAGGRM